MSRTESAGLTPNELAAIRAPIDKALTLPARAFVSDEFYALEVERIFTRYWIALCHETIVKDSGDMRSFELAGMPLAVVRGNDGRVRVFHNIVPYDGCLAVLKAQQTATAIETYYHGIKFDLRGRLVEAPFWDGSSKGPKSLGAWNSDLVEVRSETRLGVVWVDLGGHAGGIDTHLAPLMKLLAVYDVGNLVQVEDDDRLAREGYLVKANWKTYLENAAINILHESFTHDAYRKSPEIPRAKDGKRTFSTHLDGPLLAFSFSLRDVASTYDFGGATPHIGRGRAPDRGYFVTHYPNIVIPIRWNMMRLCIVHPEGPGQTRLLRCSYFSPAALAHPDFPDYQKRIVARYQQVLQEDQIAMEAVQQARRSPAWRQHFYAPFWDDLHYGLNRLVAEDIVHRPGRARLGRRKSSKARTLAQT